MKIKKLVPGKCRMLNHPSHKQVSSFCRDCHWIIIFFLLLLFFFFNLSCKFSFSRKFYLIKLKFYKRIQQDVRVTDRMMLSSFWGLTAIDMTSEVAFSSWFSSRCSMFLYSYKIMKTSHLILIIMPLIYKINDSTINILERIVHIFK